MIGAVVGNAKIGYRPQEPVSPHFRSLFSLTLSFSLLFSPFRRTALVNPLIFVIVFLDLC